MFRNLLIVIALLISTTGTAQAELLFGVKSGTMLVDVEGASVSDDPGNGGIMLGYELGILAGDLALEAEFTRSTATGTVSGQDLEVETNGLFLSYTTPGPIYLKVRGGLMNAKVEAGPFSEDESGEAFGIGVGFSLGLLRLEVEYTAVDDDIDFISVGIVF
jgi:outer membrane immunogenic protein